ncbi:MAG TPA: hypothetical protein VKR79_12225 [Gaiellaceae bacterium]|nr:hypothetical protein [Gaiellaceae bacterium]
MFTRRFILVLGVLVALNTALWLTPQGLALREVALPSLFGKTLMRGEVVLTNGQDWRIDRGVITSIAQSQLTLKEADGRVQPIGVSGITTVVAPSGKPLSLSVLGKGWHVLVTWPANGTADTIKVEKRGSAVGGGNGGRGHSKQ